MTKQWRLLLEQVQNGTLSIEEAERQLQQHMIRQLDFAQVDFHRAVRQGFPEVIFCENKTLEDIASIAREIYSHHGLLLATHATEAVFEHLQPIIPDLQWNPRARCVYSTPPPPKLEQGVAILTAGTSDIPVAEEAAVTLTMFGFPPRTVYDVGVAGIHRLNHHWEAVEQAAVLIVVAGMEGALPSVVGGLTDKPVIAVPTSVGYGSHFGGITALLAMLNSCANSITVVNIDNGFGAGYAAALILRQIIQFHQKHGETHE